MITLNGHSGKGRFCAMAWFVITVFIFSNFGTRVSYARETNKMKAGKRMENVGNADSLRKPSAKVTQDPVVDDIDSAIKNLNILKKDNLTDEDREKIVTALKTYFDKLGNLTESIESGYVTPKQLGDLLKKFNDILQDKHFQITGLGDGIASVVGAISKLGDKDLNKYIENKIKGSKTIMNSHPIVSAKIKETLGQEIATIADIDGAVDTLNGLDDKEKTDKDERALALRRYLEGLVEADLVKKIENGEVTKEQLENLLKAVTKALRNDDVLLHGLGNSITAIIAKIWTADKEGKMGLRKYIKKNVNGSKAIKNDHPVIGNKIKKALKESRAIKDSPPGEDDVVWQ